ncbi:hypothetical protein [Sphingomonas lacusdianchii]|uniref:hypothetical protein n=1 Tax=Sphingomonas lacusdianchii TaxID=2917992 RepID=UPI001F581481|nr:hypothetical protein [Sphingomonas sp. JXJ CY 53]
MIVSSKQKQLHAETIAAAHALRDAVQSGGIPVGFGQLRMSFAGASKDMLASVQAVMAKLDFDMRRQLPGLERVVNSERELRLIYSQHVSRWPTTAIEADFSRYAAEVCALVARVKPHTELLEKELYEPAARMFAIIV